VADALGGDSAMARFLIGRLCPPASADQPVDLGLAPGEERDPTLVLTKTLRAVADGEISPKQALQIGRLVAIIARLKKAVGLSSSAPLQGRSATAPVSDLDSEIPLSLAGEGGDPARSDGEGEGRTPTPPTSPAALTPPLSRKRGREVKGGAPVSGQYFSPRTERSDRHLPSPPPHAGEAEETPALEPFPTRGGGHRGSVSAAAKPPVSDLYFSARDAFRAPRSDLFSTTAIGLAAGMAALRGVESPRAALPI
jgi:hypothetical protein